MFLMYIQKADSLAKTASKGCKNAGITDAVGYFVSA